MANRDKSLRELLLPIFANDAERVEAALPQARRSTWRRIGSFLHRASGPKKRDHRDLLLLMAELDFDAAHTPRQLAAAVLQRYPVVIGAAPDDRQHVQLPDGTRPAKKDLLDRLVREYAAHRTTILREVADAQSMVDRLCKRMQQKPSMSIDASRRWAPVKPTTEFIVLLRALPEAKQEQRFTMYQLDRIRQAIMKRRRSS